MNKLFGAVIAITMLFAIDALVLTKSAEAQVSCSTDVWGNYVCRDSYGNSSTTRRDVWGNDVTNFSTGGTMSCRTDVWGNYVCN